jgi:hypothetical protein
MKPMKPLGWLILIGLFGACLLGAWWVSLAAPERLERLGIVMATEQGTLAPPATLLAQPEWLVAHRLLRLQGMTGLTFVAICVGAGEGLARRRRDPLGGFRLLWWKGGIASGLLLVVSACAYLILPWPVPFLWIALGLAGLAGLWGYALTRGKPSLP